jgi:hypothetical protein
MKFKFKYILINFEGNPTEIQRDEAIAQFDTPAIRAAEIDAEVQGRARIMRKTGPVLIIELLQDTAPDELAAPPQDHVNHPQHYGGDTQYEAIKVIEAWELGFCLGNTVKYISRAGKKDQDKRIEDLKKARWYLDREIQRMEKQ